METIFKNVEVYGFSRLNNSSSGNPRYRLETSDGSFVTKPDASLGYGIENFTNSRFPERHFIGNPGRRVDLVADGRRQVWGFMVNGELMR